MKRRQAFARWASWIGLLLISLITFVIPGAAHALSSTISDYPRYGTEFNAQQQQELRHAARAVAGMLFTGASVDVAIFGHADFDAGGSPVELRVSTERARSAENALRSMIAQELAAISLPPDRIRNVTITSTGIGTLRPVFPRPRSEEERRANRRVEFVWTASAGPPPPPAEPIFQRCARVIASVPGAGPKRRMSCVCNKLQQSAPPVGDTHYDFRAKQQLPGSAGFPSLTPEQWSVAMQSLTRHLRTDIRAVGQGASDADFTAGLVTLDDTVGRNIKDFQMQTNAGAATGLLDLALLADIRGRMADPNHTYSCYANYSRATHDQ